MSSSPLAYEYERDDYYCYPGSLVLKNELVSRRLRGVADKTRTPKCTNCFQKISNRATFVAKVSQELSQIVI